MHNCPPEVKRFIENAIELDDRDLEQEVWKIAGPAQKHFRQAVMTALAGEKVAVSKSGVHAVCEKLKAYKSGERSDVVAESKVSRHELMMEAKKRGIKNFRVLNKEELQAALAEDVTQEEIKHIVAGAVTRWKAGWGKRKVAS